MSESCPVYRVWFTVSGSNYAHKAGDGPWDYRSNAIEHRNNLFARAAGVDSCWIEKEGISTGKVLRR